MALKKLKPRAYLMILPPCHGKSYNGENPNCKICDLSDKCEGGRG